MCLHQDDLRTRSKELGRLRNWEWQERKYCNIDPGWVRKESAKHRNFYMALLIRELGPDANSTEGQEDQFGYTDCML